MKKQIYDWACEMTPTIILGIFLGWAYVSIMEAVL